MSWWEKNEQDRDMELKGEICAVCLYSVWDCICTDTDEAQYIKVGDHARQVIATMRRAENNVVSKKRKS